MQAAWPSEAAHAEVLRPPRNSVGQIEGKDSGPNKGRKAEGAHCTAGG